MHAASDPTVLTSLALYEESIAEKLAKDNVEDDRLLNNYISISRMNFHWQAACELAQQAVDEDHVQKEGAEAEYRNKKVDWLEKQGSWREIEEMAEAVEVDEDMLLN